MILNSKYLYNTLLNTVDSFGFSIFTIVFEIVKQKLFPLVLKLSYFLKVKFNFFIKIVFKFLFSSRLNLKTNCSRL